MGPWMDSNIRSAQSGVQLKNQMSKKPETSPGPSSTTSAELDPLKLLSHLQARKVLCTSCGHRQAVHVNTYNEHCQECADASTQMYAARKKVSKLDEVLCKRVTEWAEALIKGN
jgi:hypothetical protein